MARAKSVYVCSECAGQSPKWQGQCPACGAWNTLVESAAAPANSRFEALAGQTASVLRLSSIEARESPRQPTGIGEFDRVLGGGLVPGAVILLGGDPGVGKSTLLLQAMAAIGASRQTLYVTGEESPVQMALRAERLGLLNAPVDLLAEIRLEAILTTLRARRPEVAVIDSIQTVYTEALQSAPGSVAQVRECAAQLTRFAKQEGTTVILVGHVTKEGAIAGPRVLEHIVDTVLYFEGEAHSSFRLVRAIKNRFGPVNELGVFAMTDRGVRGVTNPSALFVSSASRNVAGSCVTATLEGTRPLLIEIQALVSSTVGAAPRRLAVGLDPQRVTLLLAVLHRHAGVNCLSDDVFANAVGGVRIGEPAADLAIALAISSSLKNKALGSDLLVFGEVGLTGEIRPVQRGQERLREAAKVGYRRAFIPDLNKPKQSIENMEISGFSRISDVLAAAFE